MRIAVAVLDDVVEKLRLVEVDEDGDVLYRPLGVLVGEADNLTRYELPQRHGRDLEQFCFVVKLHDRFATAVG